MAQFSDSFTDDELDYNPGWIRKSGDFEAIDGRLHSTNANGGSIVFGISSKYNSAKDTFFSVDMELLINPSGSNYVDVFIAADTLVELATQGYFIRIGNTKDEISFYKLTNGIAVEQISGMDNFLNKSSSRTQIQLMRNSGQRWSLYARNMDNGIPMLQGSWSDSTFSGGSYCGIAIRQTGTTAIGKHFLDNIYFGNIIPPAKKPELELIKVVQLNTLELTFSAEIGTADTNSFSMANFSKPTNVTIQPLDKKKVSLWFISALLPNQVYILQFSDILDIQGNKIIPGSKSFCTFQPEEPSEHDLIITEIMANPTPSAGSLPEEEYIEIWNRSGKTLSLKNCKLTDAVSSTNLPDSLLLPGSYYVLSKNTSNYFSQFPNWIGCSSFPNLNNYADVLSIISPGSVLINSVSYNEKWHNTAFKRIGGWSLERLDTVNFCLNEGHWGSNSKLGGSPGVRNSTYQVILDVPFYPLRTFCPDAYHTILFFSHPLDSSSLTQFKGIILNNDRHPTNISFYNPDKTAIICTWNQALDSSVVYPLILKSIYSCNGLKIDNNKIFCGLPVHHETNTKLKINEILFNPQGDNADYMELVNAGDQIIDLADFRICNKKSDGEINETVKIPKNTFSLLPGEFIVFSTEPDRIANQYPKNNPLAFARAESLPAMPNDAGWVAIITTLGITIDECKYDRNMHYPVLSNDDGVSLEKIHPMANSYDPGSWTSASFASGFGTPGITNSQYQNKDDYNTNISLKENWFSPDNDGIHDNLIIQYKFDKPGYYLNSTIYSETGFSIGTVHRNISLDKEGILGWNGDHGNALIAAGNYVLFIEYFHPDGETGRKKLTFSVLK